MIGVSFVVPVHNGAGLIRESLQAILAQADGRPFEVIVVDDRSRDESSAVLRQLAARWPLRIVNGEGRGAAAALNVGIRAARFPIVCQVDQDVVLKPGWMARLAEAFADPSVGGVQGYYETDRAGSLCARVMGFDLEQRYASIRGSITDHICTGNSAYRAEALRRVGLFDEALGYGYDNDVSYRLREAGYELRLNREARSVHRWREGLVGYAVQQYGFGYGRLDLLAKHPRRLTGDAVSPPRMMAHPVLTSAALLAVVVGFTTFGLMLLACLMIERSVAGIRAARLFGSLAPLHFAWLHQIRNMAWVTAIAAWSIRRLLNRPWLPAHSMKSRSGRDAAIRAFGGSRQPPSGLPGRMLCVIPAHNEAANLPTVVRELRVSCPALDVLVVDDGSTDATSLVADNLNARLLRLPERLGIGTAMRAGLRYAAHLGYDIVVRVDGDGQHRADDISRLIAPILAGEADAVVGSRFTTSTVGDVRVVRVAQRALAACLSTIIGARVTDATSGFSAFGRRAIYLLAEHHPTGYPEPELVLLLSRSGLVSVETPVGERGRLSGRTSLTPGRLATAFGCVLLAMVMAPLRRTDEVTVD